VPFVPASVVSAAEKLSPQAVNRRQQATSANETHRARIARVR
jgi:hypothetical protein